jgi:predicted transcriptional regulator
VRRLSIRASEDFWTRLYALAVADHRDWPSEATLLLEQAIAIEEKRRARTADQRVARALRQIETAVAETVQ